jgi:DNA polymerase-3 subunit beta
VTATVTSIAPPAIGSTTDLAFRAEPKPFAAACTWAARQLPARPTIPTLGGLLLEVSGGRLTVSGFDYDVATSSVIDVTGDQPGRALVSGRLLAALVGGLPGQPVDVRVDGNHVAVTCGKVEFTLPTMPVEDYPQLPEQPPAIGTVDAVAFAAAVEQVVVASDRDGSQKLPVLTGIHLAFAGDRLDVMATDAYRGATAHLDWVPSGPNVAADALVPANALAEAAKMLGAVGGEVTVRLDALGALLGLTGAGSGFTARLLDKEKMPTRNIQRVTPPRADAPATVATAEMVAALKRAELVRAPKSAVSLAFDGAGTVTVSAAGVTGNERTNEVVDCVYAGPPITVRCNPTFLIDGLTALHSPTAEFTMTDPRKPVLLTPLAAEESAAVRDYQHLVMPIKPA